MRGSNFHNSHASGTFCPTPSSQQILYQYGLGFLIHTPRVYLGLHFRHSKFILEQVEFPDSYASGIFRPVLLSQWIYLGMNYVSQLTRLKHILSYAFTVADLSCNELGFPNSRASSTFDLCLHRGKFLLMRDGFFLTHVPLLWRTSFVGRVFPTHISRAPLDCVFVVADFLSCGMDFPNSCLRHIQPIPPRDRFLPMQDEFS